MLICHGLESWSHGARVRGSVSCLYVAVSLGFCHGACVMGACFMKQAEPYP